MTFRYEADSLPPSQPSTTSSSQLAPHPQNVANAAKLLELEQAYAAISLEENQRKAVGDRYDALAARRAEQRPLAEAALTPVAGELRLGGFVGRTGPESMEEALGIGRELLEGKGAGEKKGKGREEPEEDPALVAIRMQVRCRAISHPSPLQVLRADHLLSRLPALSKPPTASRPSPTSPRPTSRTGPPKLTPRSRPRPSVASPQRRQRCLD